MSTPLTAADVDEQYQPTLARATICLNSALVLEIQRLEEQLAVEMVRDENENRAAVAPGIAARILELQAEAKASEVEFVFKGIERLIYSDLLRAHPPTKEQNEQAGGVLAWNTDTFPPALMTLAAVSPTGTDAAWWTRKYNQWTAGQIQRVWSACMAAQGGVVDVPKAIAASELIHGSEQSSS